jgi:hypothetical protein
MKKKGVSEIVSYVLLIIVAIAISATVYTFFKFQIPQDVAECNPDINVVIKSVECNIAEEFIEITIENKGLFSIDGAFIRLGEEGRAVRRQLNAGNESFEVSGLSDGQLKPGEDFSARYKISNILNPIIYDYVLEVQPGIIEDSRLLPCEEEVVTSQVRCDVSGTIYQENATNYWCEGDWSPTHSCGKVIDADWSTWGNSLKPSVDATGTIYLNYTKPSGVKNTSLWKVKYSDQSEKEYEIPESCWTLDPLQFRIDSNYFSGPEYSAFLYCMGGTGLIQIESVAKGSNSDLHKIFEEAMIWNFTEPSTGSTETQCGPSDTVCPPGCTNPPDPDCPSTNPCGLPSHLYNSNTGICTARISNVNEDGDISVQSFTREKTNDEINIQPYDPPTDNKKIGYIEWNISEIPTSSTIGSINFTYQGTQQSSALKGEAIRGLMLSEPVDITSSTIIVNTAINNPQYYPNGFTFVTSGENTLELRIDAVNDLQSSIDLGLDRFAMAFISEGFSKGDAKIASSEGATNQGYTSPTLIVGYAPCDDGVCASNEDSSSCPEDCGSPPPPTTTEVFLEDFEDVDCVAFPTENCFNETEWDIIHTGNVETESDAAKVHGGIWSMYFKGDPVFNPQAQTRAGVIDLTSYTNCNLSIWAYFSLAWDATDEFYVDVVSQSYSERMIINGISLTNGNTETWAQYNYSFSDPRLFNSDFRLELESKTNQQTEHSYVDDISIICN